MDPIQKEALHYDIKLHVQSIFNQYPNLQSFSWKSAAVWNDDWYDNTVAFITVNHKYTFEFGHEIEDLKNTFKSIHLDFTQDHLLSPLQDIIIDLLNQSKERFKNVFNATSKDYNLAKRHFIEAIEISYTLNSWPDLVSDHYDNQKDYYDAFNFFEPHQKVNINEYRYDERVNLLEYIFRENVLKKFIKITDQNAGLQNLLIHQPDTFVEKASQFFEKYFVKHLLQNDTLKYFHAVGEVLQSIFINYFQIETPLRKFEEILSDDIIPNLSANRKTIEIRRWSSY